MTKLNGEPYMNKSRKWRIEDYKDFLDFADSFETREAIKELPKKDRVNYILKVFEESNDIHCTANIKKILQNSMPLDHPVPRGSTFTTEPFIYSDPETWEDADILFKPDVRDALYELYHKRVYKAFYH